MPKTQEPLFQSTYGIKVWCEFPKNQNKQNLSQCFTQAQGRILWIFHPCKSISKWWPYVADWYDKKWSKTHNRRPYYHGMSYHGSILLSQFASPSHSCCLTPSHSDMGHETQNPFTLGNVVRLIYAANIQKHAFLAVTGNDATGACCRLQRDPVFGTGYDTRCWCFCSRNELLHNSCMDNMIEDSVIYNYIPSRSNAKLSLVFY